VTERPPTEQAPNLAAATLLDRQRAALVLDLGDGGDTGAYALAAQLEGRFLPLARDPDLYALVARGRSKSATFPVPTVPGAARTGYSQDLDVRVWELECFAKPLVTLLSGSPSSAALAMALAGTHRVAGDAFACEIADVRRGAVPPGIIMHALARLPDGVGAYLLTTGCIIGAVDALGLGFVTHCIADAQFDDIVAALSDADPVDPVLDKRHLAVGESALEPVLDLIVRHFATDSMSAIVLSLSQETGAARLWAATTAVQVAAAPKAASLAGLTVLALAKTRDIRETTIVTARANALLKTPTAQRMDAKDWLAHLSAARDGDLDLPSRATLQSLRRSPP
jgi:enoyl-CoA hydratase